MNRTVFYAGIALVVIGIVGRFYAAQYTHVTPDGILRDSLWLPIGSFMVIFGTLALLVCGVQYAITYLRSARS